MDNIQPSSAPAAILIPPSSATESLATATVAVADDDDDEVNNESTSDNHKNQYYHHDGIIGTLPYLSRIKAPVTQQQQHEEEDQQPVQRFAFVVAYDGTPFHGLAKDPKQPNTIQEYVEKRLSAMLGGRPCNITLNGRTDAGVHSNGTVFHFDMTKEEIERFANYKKNSRRSQSEKEIEKKIQQHSSSSAAEAATENASYATARMFRNSLRRGLVGMEGRVEQLIQIRNVFPVNYHKFHARKSCIGKQYTYKIHEGYPLPLEARSCWAMNGNRLDIKKMDIVAQQTLVGIHDCSILVRDKRCRSDYRSPIRQIYKIQILRTENDNNNDDYIDKQQQQQHGITVAKTTSPLDDEDCDCDSSFSSSSPKFGRIVIQIQADFFLRNMCRRIAGLLVQVGLGRCEPQEVHDNLFVEEQKEQEEEADDNNNNNSRRKAINDARSKFIMTAPAKGLRLDYVLYDANGNGKDPTLPATTTTRTTTWANCSTS